MGISTSMYIALSGMHISQAAMQVSSHNIANVNTPGYSRQRINLATMATWPASAWGQMGTGVNANNISRYHDDFLTRNLIEKGSEYGNKSAQKAAIDSLEAYYNESDGNGINAAMNDFFASWDRLADGADLKPTREELLEVSRILAEQASMRQKDMDNLKIDLNQRIEEAVHQVNALTKEIAALNDQIMTTEDLTKNQEANDLRDTRDELMRQLAELIDIQYTEDPHDGAISITTPKGAPLVQKTASYPLTTSSDTQGDIHIYSNAVGWQLDITDSLEDGAIGGWLNFRDETLREFQLQYDSFVDNLVFQINNQHAQGVGQALYSDLSNTNKISNLPAYDIPFPGDDNDIRVTARVPHLESKEPYDPKSDPENIAVRFVKADSVYDQITSNVVWNDDPAIQRWEVTISLPVDSNGNVSCTAKEVIAHINKNRSASSHSGVPTLPPDGPTPYQVGDFIDASASFNNNWTGTANFAGGANPPGQNEFYVLDRSLQHVADQGHHLTYAKEQADLTTNQTHLDKNVYFQAYAKGEAGDKIAVEYVDPGTADSALGVTVTTDQDGTVRLSVSLGTDANGQVNTTAGQIVKLINTNDQTRNLVAASTPEGQSGQGLVDVMEKTYLSRSGSFDIVTYDSQGEPTFNTIVVDPTDTLEDVLDRIGTDFNTGVKGIRAEIVTDKHGRDIIRLMADREGGVQFGFANDTSGALAVLGLNNLYSGHNGSDIALNQVMADNRDLLATGRIDAEGNITAGDNTNALDLADLKNVRADFYHLGSATLGTAFNTLYSDIGSVSQTITRGHDFISQVMSEMQDQQDMLAGVNLDEELADVLRFQYMYQASAKMISTIDTMMETLLAMR